MATTTEDALAERYDELTVTIENLRQLDRECAGPEEGFRACNVLTNRFAQGACLLCRANGELKTRERARERAARAHPDDHYLF